MKNVFLFCFLFVSLAAFGQTNYVAHFNGTNASIDLGDSISTGVRTVSFYFRPNVTITPSISGPMTFLARNDATEAAEWGIYIHATPFTGVSDYGKLCFSTRFNDDLQAVYSISNTWTAGVWYHVCATVDSIDGMKLYIDGILQSTNPAIKTSMPARPETLGLGTWGDAHIRYFDGCIEELSFWNNAFTTGDIQKILCQPLNPSSATGMIAYYRFNEGSGSVINNELPGFPGAVNGTTWIADSTCVDYATLPETNPLSDLVYVFPNPAEDLLNIGVPLSSEDRKISLYSITGQLLFQQTSPATLIQVSLESFARGVYLLKVSDQDNVAVRKIIKK